MLTILGTLSVIWYGKEEEGKLDKFLYSETSAIKYSIESFYQSKKNSENTNEEDLSLYLEKLASERLTSSSQIYQISLLVFDLQGNRLNTSNGPLKFSNTYVKSIADSLDEHPIIPIETKIEDDKEYRLTTRALIYKDRIFAGFQIWILTTSSGGGISEYNRNILIVLISAGLVFGFLGSWFIDRTLRVVRKITLGVKIHAEKGLTNPIPIPPGNDEIHDLAVTFNLLLARLEKDFKFQEELLGQLSHQLRTPLTIIRGRNQNALDNLSLSHSIKSVLEENLADVDSLSTLLNTLLNLARQESQVDSLRLKSIDLIQLTKETVSDLSPLWEEKNLRFEWITPQLGKLKPNIEGDPDLLKQAILNILTNTYKYSPRDSLVLIKIFPEEKEKNKLLNIVLLNQGPPILEGEQTKIFQKFFRSNSNTLLESDNMQSTTGFGLGLNISKVLIERHHGTIAAFNPKEGGAGFHIQLPAAKIST